MLGNGLVNGANGRQIRAFDSRGFSACVSRLITNSQRAQSQDLVLVIRSLLTSRERACKHPPSDPNFVRHGINDVAVDCAEAESIQGFGRPRWGVYHKSARSTQKSWDLLLARQSRIQKLDEVRDLKFPNFQNNNPNRVIDAQ